LLKLERIQGYPSAYLLARIRGRRSRLIRDWRPVLYDTTPLDHLASSQYQGFVRERTPEGMWRALLLEHGWVHRQMDDRLRQAFATYFLYAELRTVFICLRCLEGDKEQMAGEVLGASLLSAEAQAILREGEVEAALTGVERLFGALSPLFAGLAAVYEEKGMRETERFLTHRYLEYVTGLPLHPVLRGFFKRIIDSRNILALYKALRTGGPREGIFLAGGNVPVERMAVLMEKEDILEVAGLVRLAAGVKIALPEPTQVEVALYRGITRFLAGAGRDPLDEALILDYLWRCQLEVMNLSMLLAAKGLERDEAAAELVR
jgi:vacuolar-type H+-ATPase subunit C/Vma6